MKRIVSFMLALMLICGILPGKAEALVPGSEIVNAVTGIQKYMLVIVGGVALVVLIVAVALLLRKPKSGSRLPVEPVIHTAEELPVESAAEEPSAVEPATEGPVTQPVSLPQVTIPMDAGNETVPVRSTYLVDSSGALGGQSFLLSPEGVLIGRAANTDIRYGEDTIGVSRNHCQVYWEGEKLMLVDMGSTSGTYLLDKGRLWAHTPAQIQEGDVICLGSKKVALTVIKK